MAVELGFRLTRRICCDFFMQQQFLSPICDEALGKQLSESKPKLGLDVPLAFIC